MKKTFKLLLVAILILCLFGCHKSEKKDKIVDENITSVDTSESNANNSVSQEDENSQNVVAIDLKPEWLKYRDITLNRDYLSNTESNLYMIDDRSSYDGEKEFYETNEIGVEQIDGIEIYGIYFDDIEINEELTSESTIIYNFPSTIDGKDVISIAFSLRDTELKDRIIDGKKVTNAEVNLPENVILISGINANLIHVNDNCKYVSNCYVMDRFTNNMVIFNLAYFFFEENELLLGNNLVLDYSASIDIGGHIEKIIIDGVSSVKLGRISFRNDAIKNSLKEYSDWYLGDVYIESSIPEVFCDANSIHLGDGIELNYLNFGNGQANSDMIFEIGKNVILNEYGKLEGEGVKKLIIGTPNVVGQINIDKDCQIINRSGEEINWSQIIRYNHSSIKSDQIFKSGRLDMGDFAINVTEE